MILGAVFLATHTNAWVHANWYTGTNTTEGRYPPGHDASNDNVRIWQSLRLTAYKAGIRLAQWTGVLPPSPAGVCESHPVAGGATGNIDSTGSGNQ